MKRLISFLTLVFLSNLLSAQFEAGDKVRLSEPSDDDLYMAGGEVTVDATVHGDCLLAGGKIAVNDSVTQDLIVGGGDIFLRGYVGDDVRVAGGTIEIDSEVMDDLIVFGGDVLLPPQAVIHGNVVCYAGELTIHGTVHGELKASGGEITIDGPIHGSASMSAESIEIGNRAEFGSDVSYWTEEGEVDFGTSVKKGVAQFDESLSWDNEGYSAVGTFLGVGILFMFLFIAGGFLIVLLLEWAFGKWFSGAASQVVSSWSRSLGVGVIYFVGLPILILVSFMIVIGIPIGVVGLALYIFSLVFGNFVAALVLAHLWKARNQKTWNLGVTALIALAIAVVLQLLTSIPFLGFLISFVVFCITYGAIILAIRSKKSGGGSKPGVQVQPA